jgi:glycosyltransferase involved in cell wall biosynthesis
MRALICIPVFNEANTILDVVRGLRSITDADILVVDDGSTDGSRAAIEKSGLHLPHYVRHRRNLGYGFALRTGFRFALERYYDQLITIDSDGQHLPEDLPRLLDALPGAEVVSGSRFHPQSPKIGSPPTWRLLANQALTEMVCRHTGYSITDSACGLRAYRASALSQLRITEAGYTVPYELWGQMACSGISVSEVPVTRIYRNEGQLQPPDSQTSEQMIALCERVLLRELRGESHSAFFFRVLKNTLRSVAQEM